jgi:tetratricopeptide (TPR) repeat protein
LLFKNFYSYTEPDSPFVNHHWLYGVIVYGVYTLGGFKVLSLFNILLALLTFSLAFSISSRRAGFYLSALVSLPFILILSERVEVRPEMFSYLFFFLVWYLLEFWPKPKQLLWLLPLIFLFWINIHIYFFLGFVLVGVFAIMRSRNKTDWLFWLKVGGLSGLACFINPNTYRSVLYPLNIFNNYGYEIAENKSIFFLEKLFTNPNILLFKILVVVLVVSWLIRIYQKKRVPLFDLFWSIFVSVLSVLAIRNFPLFALVGFIIVATNLATLKVYWFKWKESFYFLFSLLLIISFSIFIIHDGWAKNNFIRKPFGLGLSAKSSGSAEFFLANNLVGPIFNNYDVGSALIFWLYPKEKVFVDNRPEAYSYQFFADIYRPMQLEEDKWQEYSEKYNFNIIYFSYTDSTPWASSFLAKRLSDSDWPLIYLDERFAIMIKNTDDNQILIDKFKIDQGNLEPAILSLANQADFTTKLHLSSLATLANLPNISEQVLLAVLADRPSDGRVLSALAYLYASSADQQTRALSLDYFTQAVKSGQNLPGIYNSLGLTYWSLGNYFEAKATWQRTLQIDRQNETALDYLKQLEELQTQNKLFFY